MCIHTIMLPKQIRSDASACACQEHAERAQGRERESEEEDWERDSMYVWDVTCPLVHAKIIQHPCQVQKHMYKRNGIQAVGRLREWDAEDLLSRFMCV